MIRDLGIVRPGTTLYIPFHTFDSNDPSASVTLTGLATTDIEIYKDGSTTQRASDSGYALLDTDGIDFDTTTGIHGISVDLADNTTAGFYAAGSQYFIVIASVTIDAATVNFVLCTFRIGYPDAVINTTIATLASQTSFTLTSGPAEDDALNGCVVCIHDVASAVQCGFGVVSDYTGASKTVTLVAGTTFTAAASDNIAIFPPTNLHLISGAAVSTSSAQLGVNVVNAAGTAWGSGAITAASIAADAITAAKIADGAIDAATFAAGAINAAAIAADAIGASELAADAVAEIADAIWDEDATAHQTGGTFGQAIGDPGADTNTIFKAVVTDATGATVGVDVVDLKTQIGVAGAGLTAIDLPDQTMNITGNITGNLSGSVGSVTGAVGSVTGNVWGNVAGSVASVTARVTANVDQLNGDATAAATLAILNGATVVYRGTVSGATTTTTLIDSGLTQADTDWWKGRVIIFTSGITLQATDITAFDPATDKLTFTAVTTAPTAGPGGSTYVII